MCPLPPFPSLGTTKGNLAPFSPYRPVRQLRTAVRCPLKLPFLRPNQFIRPLLVHHMVQPPLITLVAYHWTHWTSCTLASTDRTELTFSLQGHTVDTCTTCPQDYPFFFFFFFFLMLVPPAFFFQVLSSQSIHSPFDILHGVIPPQVQTFLFPCLNFQTLLSVVFFNVWRSCCISYLLSRVSDALLQVVIICKCAESMLQLFWK